MWPLPLPHVHIAPSQFCPFHAIFTPLPKIFTTAQKSIHPRNSAGHDEREAYAQVILGRNYEYGGLPHEPVHNIRSARGHYARKTIRKEAGLIAHPDIWRNCIRAHSRWKAEKARSKVGEMYPRRILTRTKGVQMLQSIHPKSSSRDVVFDESASWYAREMIPTPTLINAESAEQEPEDRGHLEHCLKIARLQQG